MTAGSSLTVSVEERSWVGRAFIRSDFKTASLIALGFGPKSAPLSLRIGFRNIPGDWPVAYKTNHPIFGRGPGLEGGKRASPFLRSPSAP